MKKIKRIVLLKIETNSNDNLKFEFNLEYETVDGKKSSQNYEYEIPSDKLNVNYFSNRNIQKGISIYYFTEVLNAFVEKYNKLNNYNSYNSNLKNKEEEKKKEIEFIENAQSVRDYLKQNYVFNKNDKESKKK